MMRGNCCYQAIGILLVMLLAACNGVEPVPSPAPPLKLTNSDVLGSAPRSTVTPAAIELSSDTLISYRRSGCLAGVDETLTVSTTGNVDYKAKTGLNRQSTLRPEQLDSLKKLLTQPDFATLQPLYQALGADLCVYRLTTPVRGRQSRTVTTMDGAQHPELLQQVLNELEQLRQQVK